MKLKTWVLLGTMAFRVSRVWKQTKRKARTQVRRAL